MYRGKRFFALVLGLVFLFGACGMRQEGTGVPETTNVPTEYPVATVAPTTEPTMTVAPTDAPKREEFFDENPTGIPRVTQEPMVTIAPIEPSPTTEPVATPIPTGITKLEPVKVGMDGVLIDNELCRIQAVSLEKGEYYYVLHLSVENRTEKELKFYAGDVYVNRVECCDWDCEVPAGETSEEELTLYGVEEYAGVTELLDITELYLPLEIYDEREAWLDIFEVSWEGYWPEPIFQQTIYYYPQGEAQYVSFTYERQPDDVVVVDNEELTLLIIGDVYKEGGGYEIKLFLENHTDKRVWYEIEELALNGFLCQLFYEWECELYPGTGTYGTIEYFDHRKDETEGDTITEISFSLLARSRDFEYGFHGDYMVNLQGEEPAQEYVYVPGERDVVLYDGPEVLLAMTDIELSEKNGKIICTATAYAENKTEETLYLRCENTEAAVVREGEYYLPDEWNDYVNSGKKRKVQLMLYDCLESWEEKGKWFVTLPLEMSLSADDSYNNDTFYDETITLLISEEEIGIVSDD